MFSKDDIVRVTDGRIGYILKKGVFHNYFIVKLEVSRMAAHESEMKLVGKITKWKYKPTNQ